MEIEHVNDNIIRVVLGPHDLEERGINMLDLLGNRKQIEDFFYSILEEVDTDHSFTKDQAVTFQVMPNANGLELLISKVTGDHEEEPATVLAHELDDAIEEEKESNAVSDANSEGNTQELVINFEQFEDFLALSRTFYLENGRSDLYRYQDDYYLKLTVYPEELRQMDIEDIKALVSEYGQVEEGMAAMISEFGKSIMAQTALELARYYFLSTD
ncbi:adaptor protein MecA [Lactobacillus sp. DCY120]|uniref:Adaptor protein MecA n=1 Tax=Bombilactobacillus apium TaxID=2675299 RepID=A0A850R497_9LACO|nr:adaptor protein MecA [Bombilactobacillus apium]NVY96801.1 adaptor protein MecA [Bombilactobacillus apium]